ncbi:hypothetical protein JCM11641_005626 [Rhodosporidiobolus odoratus]
MRRKSTRNATRPANTATDKSAAPQPELTSTTSSTSSSKKRKSVALDDSIDSANTTHASEPPVRRSRRTSTAAATATSESSNPSAKSLGKRRALPPSPTAPESTPSTSAPVKKRKLSHLTASKTAPSPAMPRKGTRTSRAAAAKALALEDEEDAAFEAREAAEAARCAREFDEGDWNEEGDVEMGDMIVGGAAGGRKKKSSSGTTSSAAFSAGRKTGQKTDDLLAASASTEGKIVGASEEKTLKGVKGSSASEDSEDSHDESAGEGDGHGRVYDEDDEEIDEYETSLGMHGEERDDYDSEGEDPLAEAPRTFNANGDPLSSSPAADELDEAAMDEADAALFGALAGAARSGGDGAGIFSAFRTLHGMMSGMTSRLKDLLASLRSKEGDGSAKLLALQELAEILSMSTEDTLAGYFQTDAFAKELVAIVRGESNGMGGNAGGTGGMTAEEAIAFGLDPADLGAGGDTEENDVQMMLLACRCLENMMEALPGSAHSVVYAGAVPVLCDKLKDIQYIDLAEQTLSTLEKISEEVPSTIVREGGLAALLTYLDFFSFHVQRTAVTAAANCCRSLQFESFPSVLEAMPIFKNVLGYPNQRVVEQGCLAVVRIVDSYRHYPDKLDQLLTADVLNAIQRLLNPDSTTVSPITYTQALKMLTTAAKASPAVAIELVEVGIANTLYHLLTGVSAPEWASEDGKQVLDRETTLEDDLLVMQNLAQRPKEQVTEVLTLLVELLPPLPKDGIFNSRAFIPGKESRSSRSSMSVKKEDGTGERTRVKREEGTPDVAPSAVSVMTPSSSAADLESDVKMEERSDDGEALRSPSAASLAAPVFARLASGSSSRPKAKTTSSSASKDVLLKQRLELVASSASSSRQLVVKRYVALLLPTLVNVYAASVSPQVRSKAVLGLLKMVHFSEEGPLADVLHTVPFAAFISAILSSLGDEKTSPLLVDGLQLVELLLVKMPDAYAYAFRREGVMHEIERLAGAELLSGGHKRKTKATPASASTASTLDVPTPPTSTLNPLEAQTRDSITLRARHLREIYGITDSEPAVRARAILERITTLVQHLASAGDAEGQASQVGEGAKNALQELAALLADEKNPLSSFEMIQSGLVEGLLSFATVVGKGPLSPQKRQDLIAKAFMPRITGDDASPAFSVLVKRLQEALSRLEQFEVVVAAQNQNDFDTGRNGTTMLARQLKLRLVAEDDADIPRSCTNIVVSIHAIATFQAFNDYLRPRILAAQAQADRLSGSGGSKSPAVAGASSSATAKVSAHKSASPKRRRSSRLSGKGEEEGEPVASTSADVEGAAREEDEESDSADDAAGPSQPLVPLRDDPLFAGTIDSSPPAPQHERLVQIEVAEGADAKIVAKTPDGTRVSTPNPTQADPTAASTSARPSPAPTPKARASYAAALKAEPTDFHLEFSLEGQPIGLDTTIFGAIHAHEAQQPTVSQRQMWYNIYDIKFRKVAGAARPDEDDDSSALGERTRRGGSIFTTTPSSIPQGSQQATILQLLHVLRNISSDHGDGDSGQGGAGLASTAFVNSKLTAKLNRQLEEPMIVASACLPDWAIDLSQTFPFLFPFDTRFTFLQSTSFGYARLLQKWTGQNRTDNSRRDANLGFLSRLPRQKVRISRERIMDSAFKVFELYGSSSANLEVEFFDEVGSGLGPTLEFYALASKGFARKDLKLWRGSDASESSDYVHTRAGLFPLPREDFATEKGKKVLRFFHVLGQFVAKAMMDSRIVDVNFSRAFMSLVLEQDMPSTIASVKSVDPELAKSLAHLQEYVDAKDAIEADATKSDAERASAINAIKIEGVSVADLFLDFSLPGYDIELKAGGKDLPVDVKNLEEYITLVIDWTLLRGVKDQVDEFKKGFSTVFPVRDLQIFTPAELVMMMTAEEEDWSVEALTNASKADHGFTMDSRAVRDFLSVMSDLSLAERRDFLSFMTGSPRLPIGGFAALRPPLTIVRKDGGDSVLPSVMTCVNFVKLPDYTSREVVRERILLAVREGAGGFHLS